MSKLYLFLVSICLLTACSKKQTATNPIDSLKHDEYLLFQTGFEDDTKIVTHGRYNHKIIGRQSGLLKSDWQTDLKGVINDVYINYTRGDSTQRLAEITTDPLHAGNKVLHYWIKEPWQTGPEEKARVQIEFYEITGGLKEFAQSVRMFFPKEMETLRHYPDKLTWFTLVEIWNNVAWRREVPYGGRVTLGIAKPTEGEGDFYFKVDAQDHDPARLPEYPYTNLWLEINEKIKVPFGQWFTLEYYFKEGDAQNGRFYMTVQIDGQEKQTVFDITNYTYNPADPAPDGVTEFNPMKLYTSKSTAGFMKENNQLLQVYWDDFKLWGKIRE